MDKNEEATLTDVVKALCLVAASMQHVSDTIKEFYGERDGGEMVVIQEDADEYFANLYK
jgi:hypothetical protein